MSKIYNALAMLDILSNKRKYKIKELSEKLELSPRMVRYYKEQLERMGYYIESTSGLDGGYQLISDVYLPKISISKYDIELLNGIKDATDKEKYEIFNNSIKNNNRIQISYISLKNTISDRIIQPCEIFKHKDKLYVAAFCELRGEIRHFEFKRIRSIKVL